MINYTIVYLLAFRRYLKTHGIPDIPSDLVGPFAALERQRCRQCFIRAAIESPNPLCEIYLAHYVNYLDTVLHLRPGGIHAVIHHHKSDAQQFCRRIHDHRHTTLAISAFSPNYGRGVTFDSALLLGTQWHIYPAETLTIVNVPIDILPGTFIIFHLPRLLGNPYQTYLATRGPHWQIIPQGYTLPDLGEQDSGEQDSTPAVHTHAPPGDDRPAAGKLKLLTRSGRAPLTPKQLTKIPV